MKAQFPPITVDGFFTMNNLEKNLIGLNFESGEMRSTLIFTPTQVKDLIIGLEKSLKRLKERQQ